MTPLSAQDDDGSSARPLRGREALDRHVLVSAIWATSALIAAALLDRGITAGALTDFLAGFAVLLAAFAGHIIVNVAYRTAFTPRELALGLVL